MAKRCVFKIYEIKDYAKKYTPRYHVEVLIGELKYSEKKFYIERKFDIGLNGPGKSKARKKIIKEVRHRNLLDKLILLEHDILKKEEIKIINKTKSQ